MAIAINGSGTMTGISVGGLPDGIVDDGTLADDAVTLAKMASGTDGQIITYDASGNPSAVGPGSDGQVVTSTGAGSPPAFEAAPSHTGNVAFPASQSASGDANTLDDYEEGAFTPTIQDTSFSDSESQVYHGNQIGVYTKVGRVVTCNGYMNINSSSLTGTDICYLAGFPFTSRNNGTEQAVVSFANVGGLDSNIFTDYQMFGALEGNITYAQIQAPNAQTGSNQFKVSTLSGGYFSFSVTYFV